MRWPGQRVESPSAVSGAAFFEWGSEEFNRQNNARLMI